MKRPDVIIAIDPDVSRSGVCQLARETRTFKVFNYTIPQLCEYFANVKRGMEQLKLRTVVLVEASWANAHNRHLTNGQSRAAASKTGYNVGRNHQVGIDICNIARHFGLEVIEQPPLRKCWKGKEGKITHKEISAFTGLTGRSNQEVRDSLLIAWNYAGYPIRI